MSDESQQGGGINWERSRVRELMDDFKVAALTDATLAPRILEIRPVGGERDRWRITGKGFTPASQVYVGGTWVETHFRSDQELDAVFPANVRASGVCVENTPPLSFYPKAEARPPLTLLELRPLCHTPLRTACPFTLAVRFRSAGDVPVRLLRLHVVFPDGHRIDRSYRVSAEQNQHGQTLLEGIQVERGGLLQVRAALYDEGGNADYLEAGFPVVPSNPLQLYVYPVHSSPGGAGAAEYRSSQNRYYCEGRWVISNGNSYPVTIGPTVRCRVSDAGLGELADFTFSISPSTVPANSTRTVYIYTYHGSSSDVYDLFRNFGDAKYEFWLDTSDGRISNWNVWVASAQVGVTANFVGNFSWAEFLKVREIIDDQATAIYSQVDCIFSPNTPILEIPSSHSDWSRYRDIRLEENKDGVCTDSDEADDMRDDWSAPSQYDDRIDIFFVESFSGDACASSVGGFSPVGGPSGKGGDRSGIVIEVKDRNILSSVSNEDLFGVVVAHEVGHFLGLKHHAASGNFMNATGSASNTNITYGQWKAMRDHHFVRRLNP